MTTRGDLRGRSVSRWVTAAAAGGLVFVAGLGVGRLTGSAWPTNPIEATPRLESSVSEVSATPPPTTAVRPTGLAAEGVSTDELEAALDGLDLPARWFVGGTPEVSAAGRDAIEQVAAVLNAHPFIPVEVEVRTYTEGSPGENHGLSTLMADQLVAALMAGGVSPDRLVAAGLGGSLHPPDGRTMLLTFDTDDQPLADDLAELEWSAIDLTADDLVVDEGQPVLDGVADALARHPQASLTLLGYAYESTAAASHDRSHVLVDAAVDHLIGLDIDRSRLSTVGLGDAPLGPGLETIVEFEIGAPAAITLSLRPIDGSLGFEPHTAELTADSRAMIPQLAAALSLDPTTIIEIAVHTYSEAGGEENHDLSHRQGQAVVDALAEAGVAPERLVVVGHGDPPHFAQPGRDTYITFNVIG